MRTRTRPCRRTAALLPALLLAALSPLVAHAGSFGVSPIRLDLDRENRTGSVTITNDDPTAKLDMQVKLAAWTQDAQGKDVYAESNDLVFFPRILTIEPKDQRVVRVGLKVPAGATEKAYRLYLEELPKPRNPQQKGAQVAFVMRFGVPVFLPPAQGQAIPKVERIDMAAGNVVVVVTNAGNQHFRIDSLKLKAEPGFETQTAGGYVLAGASKRLTIEIPREVCRKIGKLTVAMSTDRAGEVEGKFDWDGSRCGN